MSTTYTWKQVVSAITGVVNAATQTSISLTSADLRPVLEQTLNTSGDARVWILTNSDGVNRLVFQVPVVGYYPYSTCIGVLTTTICSLIGGNATAAQVLSGYTFTNTSGMRLSGSMPNYGALNWAPSASTSYSVPAGYYSGGTLNSGPAYNTGYNNGVAAGSANTRVVKQLTLSAAASSDQRAFVDNDKNGATTNCRYIAVNPGLTAYTVTYIYWFYNNYHLCAGCTGSAGNAGFALSTFHLGSTNNSAKNLVPQYSGGTFYLPTGSGSGVGHTVHFYYV